jgi:protein-disulfide isomerase
MTKLVLVVATAAFLAGCAQDNKSIETRLAAIEKTQQDILAQLKANPGAGRGGPGAGQPQRPPRPTADPAKTYSVNVDGAPFEGPADALVTVVKGYEYACPFCDKVRPTLDELKKKYGKDLRVVHKQFVVHPQVATGTALAACAAHRQGKFGPMDEALWEKVFRARKFDKDKCWNDGTCETMDAIAKEIGLNVEKFRADMKGDCMPTIQREQKELSQVGLGATPGFFINGRFLSGAQPVEAFSALIDEELAKAKQRVAQGTPASAYYKTWVVEKGEQKAEVK